jgi:hypothetical protein
MRQAIWQQLDSGAPPNLEAFSEPQALEDLPELPALEDLGEPLRLKILER